MQRMPILSDSDMSLFELKTRYVRNYLTFAGKNSKDYLLYLSAPGVYDSPEVDMDLQTLRSIRGASELAFMNGLDMYLIRGEDNNFKITTGADLDRFRGILGMDMLHAAVRVIFED